MDRINAMKQDPKYKPLQREGSQGLRMAAEQNIVGKPLPLPERKPSNLPPKHSAKPPASKPGEESILGLVSSPQEHHQPKQSQLKPNLADHIDYQNKSIGELEAILDGYKKATNQPSDDKPTTLPPI